MLTTVTCSGPTPNPLGKHATTELQLKSWIGFYSTSSKFSIGLRGEKDQKYSSEQRNHLFYTVTNSKLQQFYVPSLMAGFNFLLMACVMTIISAAQNTATSHQSAAKPAPSIAAHQQPSSPLNTIIFNNNCNRKEKVTFLSSSASLICIFKKRNGATIRFGLKKGSNTKGTRRNRGGKTKEGIHQTKEKIGEETLLVGSCNIMSYTT